MYGNIAIQLACDDDLRELLVLDRRLSLQHQSLKLARGEVLIARYEGRLVGLLRFGFFWDEIPFMNLLIVDEPYRRRGIGAKLVEHWEQGMLAAGHELVMTSTQSDETAQHFYRKLGYADAGGFTPPGEVLELILVKRLR